MRLTVHNVRTLRNNLQNIEKVCNNSSTFGKNAYNKFYLQESKIILAGFEFQIGFVGFRKSAFKDAVKNAKFLSFLKSSSYIESD